MVLRHGAEAVRANLNEEYRNKRIGDSPRHVTS